MRSKGPQGQQIIWTSTHLYSTNTQLLWYMSFSCSSLPKSSPISVLLWRVPPRETLVKGKASWFLEKLYKGSSRLNFVRLLSRDIFTALRTKCSSVNVLPWKIWFDFNSGLHCNSWKKDLNEKYFLWNTTYLISYFIPQNFIARAMNLIINNFFLFQLFYLPLYKLKTLEIPNRVYIDFKSNKNNFFSNFIKIISFRNVELYTKSSDLYTKSSDLYTKSSDLYTKSSDLYTKSSDLYTKSSDLYAKSSDLYTKSSDLYTKSSDLYTKSSDLYTKSSDLYRKTALFTKNWFVYKKRWFV